MCVCPYQPLGVVCGGVGSQANFLPSLLIHPAQSKGGRVKLPCGDWSYVLLLQDLCPPNSNALTLPSCSPSYVISCSMTMVIISMSLAAT